MDPDIGEQVRTKVREALAAQPYRGMPHFDDVVEAAATAALHVAHVLATSEGGDLATRVANLEAQGDRVEVEAFRRVTAAVAKADAVAAELQAAVTRITALEAIGASQRQASAAAPAAVQSAAQALDLAATQAVAQDGTQES